MSGIVRIYITTHRGRYVKTYEERPFDGTQLFDGPFSFLDIDLSDMPIRIDIPDFEMMVEITEAGVNVKHTQKDLLAQE